MLETFPETGPRSAAPEMVFGKNPGQLEMDLRQIIEAIPAWVQVCDLDGTIKAVNHSATRISGYERWEMEGQRWPYPWFAASEAASGYSRGWGTDSWPYSELERSGCIPEFEVVYTTPGNETRVLGVTLSLIKDEQGSPRHVLMVAWDHTSQKARNAELARAQKIQAVNQLAAGIAHDINNNLAVILGYSEFLLSTSESFGDVVRQALSAIHEQSIDCANTVRRIQLFSRTVHKSQLSSFSVNDAILDVIATTRAAWKGRPQQEGVDIRLEADLGDVTPIFAYEEGFKEALANLVNNAMDAMPEGGTVSLVTRGCENGVIVEVKDNGVGIPQLELNRVFDAFYTTKGPGRSGLGLSIAYTLITQQGGEITINSREGEGTIAVINLPHKAAETPLAGGNRWGGQKRPLSVLVVDDEPLVADVYRTFLESFGHQVVTCLSGAKAMEFFAQEEFDLALVDLGMPNMDGWEVSRRINQMRPDFPIIVATGWNVNIEDGNEQGARVQAVLKKPFAMHDLDRAVNAALK